MFESLIKTIIFCSPTWSRQLRIKPLAHCMVNCRVALALGFLRRQPTAVWSRCFTALVGCIFEEACRPQLPQPVRIEGRYNGTITFWFCKNCLRGAHNRSSMRWVGEVINMRSETEMKCLALCAGWHHLGLALQRGVVIWVCVHDRDQPP